MRRMLEQKSIDWIKSLKDYIAQNGNQTEIGGDLEVDGKIIVNDAESLVDKHGEKIIVGGGNKVAFTNGYGGPVSVEINNGEEITTEEIDTDASVQYDNVVSFKIETEGCYGYIQSYSFVIDSYTGSVKARTDELEQGGTYVVINPFTEVNLSF